MAETKNYQTIVLVVILILLMVAVAMITRLFRSPDVPIPQPEVVKSFDAEPQKIPVTPPQQVASKPVIAATPTVLFPTLIASVTQEETTPQAQLDEQERLKFYLVNKMYIQATQAQELLNGLSQEFQKIKGVTDQMELSAFKERCRIFNQVINQQLRELESAYPDFQKLSSTEVNQLKFLVENFLTFFTDAVDFEQMADTGEYPSDMEEKLDKFQKQMKGVLEKIKKEL